MLLMIEDYKKETSATVCRLMMFNSYELYLHEMTLEELNKAVSNWTPINESTVPAYKRQIKQYLTWLKNKGVATNPEIADLIEFPVYKSEPQIFSTADLEGFFDDLYFEIEKARAANEEVPPVESFTMVYAADILAFYGMKPEEIIALSLSDVQTNGVLGYDLPLAPADIDILMRYKQIKTTGSRKLKGDGYIRSAKDTPIDTGFLSRPLYRLKSTPYRNKLKKILAITSVYEQGIFSRVYEYEIKNNTFLSSSLRRPEWFAEMFAGESQTSITQKKIKYIEYRNVRNKVLWQPANKIKENSETIQSVENSLAKVIKHLEMANDSPLGTIEIMKSQIRMAISKLKEVMEEIKKIT